MFSYINIYCDESCHLEHDQQGVMLLGALKCPLEKVTTITTELKDLKEKYKSRGELKWQKVSSSRIKYYIALVDYFFNQSDLNFRCVVVKNKNKLDHQYYNQGSHDSFYYKMYYYLLRNMINCDNSYNIYLDIKDTQSQNKINALKEILDNYYKNTNTKAINIMQQIRSKESELLQLSDFLIGTVAYANRDLSKSNAKKTLVDMIKDYTKITLTESTPPWEEKFNIFVFYPRENRSDAI